jgi:hypothetical protein
MGGYLLLTGGLEDFFVKKIRAIHVAAQTINGAESIKNGI